MTYKTYLFDMDGTLLDTLDDLTAAVNHTLEQYGYPRRTREEVRRGLGNGAVKLMASALPQGEDTPEFAAIMRDYKAWYQAHTCVLTRPYPGVPALLERLRTVDPETARVSQVRALPQLPPGRFGSAATDPDGGLVVTADRVASGSPAYRIDPSGNVQELGEAGPAAFSDAAGCAAEIPEPPPPEPVTRPMELYINGELVSKWDE